MFLTVFAAIVLLGAVIFVHELGHFLAAKAVGVGVPRFSIGFGSPTPLAITIGETEYVIAWVPLGGYVKLATREDEAAGVSSIEGGPAEGFPPEKLFENKPLWARVLVLSAGVVMNVVLAWAIYVGVVLTLGGAEDPTTTIAEVDAAALPGGAEALASLPFGTPLLQINGDTVASWDDIRSALLDVGSPRLRFDFAGEVEPIVLPIPGTSGSDRVAIYQALRPLHPARIAQVSPGRPAARAGVETDDLVIRVGADTVRYWGDLLAAVEPAAGDTLAVTVLRAGVPVDLTIVPDEVDEVLRDPTATGDRKVGYIGVGQQIDIRRVRYGPVGAALQGARMAIGSTAQVLYTVRGLLTFRVSPKELGGPIVIGQLSGQAARIGPSAFLMFMAFISINLAIFNLLPIPVLDGGHLMFLLLEGLLGRPVSMTVRLRFTQVGFAMLMALVALVVFNDVARIVTG
ncbi:MAG TPA: RIP metalloprotease RseP [Gemmatimonadales bacterium]